MDPKGVMAELTGRRGGYSKGKGGSMHMFSPEKNFYGGHGIVGARCRSAPASPSPTATAATATSAFTYFGDGAANQGQVYESFNMAELWKLPVVYVIENNQYAMGTSIERSSATTELSQRGASFNIPGEQVDGMDVRAVRAAGERAVEHARSGKGPFILEMKTYRYRGHSMSDPAKYRTREEVEEVRETRDPDRACAPAAARSRASTRGRPEGRSTARSATWSTTRPNSRAPTRARRRGALHRRARMMRTSSGMARPTASERSAR